MRIPLKMSIIYIVYGVFKKMIFKKIINMCKTDKNIIFLYFIHRFSRDCLLQCNYLNYLQLAL